MVPCCKQSAARSSCKVKLHGVRVELAEIEAALEPWCREAAVVQAAEDGQTLAPCPTTRQAERGRYREGG